MPWGGAYNRLPIDGAAFPHRRERFLLKHTIALRPHASQEQTQAARRWLARSWNATHPYGSGGVFASFPDPELSDSAHAYYGSNLDRLQVVKRNYGPDGVFHSGPSGSLLGYDIADVRSVFGKLGTRSGLFGPAQGSSRSGGCKAEKPSELQGKRCIKRVPTSHSPMVRRPGGVFRGQLVLDGGRRDDVDP
jgi:hypothetical protein